MAQTNYRTGRGILHGCVSSHALYDEHIACTANQTKPHEGSRECLSGR
jgi:hypothetical protein